MSSPEEYITRSLDANSFDSLFVMLPSSQVRRNVTGMQLRLQKSERQLRVKRQQLNDIRRKPQVHNAGTSPVSKNAATTTAPTTNDDLVTSSLLSRPL